MNEEKYIKEIFEELRFYKAKTEDFFNFKNISTGNYSPPAYIVELIFLGILKFRNYGEMEKVKWHTYFKYKDYLFLIRDYKLGKWTIECNDKKEEVEEIVKDLKAKIVKAAKIVNKLLYKELKTKVENENFYLSNVYDKLFSIYHFYEKKTRKAIKEYEKLDTQKENIRKASDIASVINKRLTLKKEILYYLFPLVLTFFSLLEFMLDVLYAFERPEIKYAEYKKKHWNEKFKMVFDIKKNKNIKLLFDELIRIKENYRNPLSHGLTNEVNLLVHLPYVGLIPLSYEYLSEDLHFSNYGFNKENAARLIETFTQFFDFLKKQEPYRYYMLFLEYPFPIPFAPEEVSKIKTFMASYEEFDEYLKDRERYEEEIINREI